MFWCVVSKLAQRYCIFGDHPAVAVSSIYHWNVAFALGLYFSFTLRTEFWRNLPLSVKSPGARPPLPFLLSMSLLKETQIIHRSSLSSYRVWVRWAGRLALALLQELAYRKAIKVRNGCRLVRRRGADTASIRQASSASPHGSVRLAVVCDWDDTLPTPAFTLPEKIDK